MSIQSKYQPEICTCTCDFPGCDCIKSVETFDEETVYRVPTNWLVVDVNKFETRHESGYGSSPGRILVFCPQHAKMFA